jgi:hypothetical protein
MADFTGISVNNADAEDLRTAKYMIGLENEKRAAADPPETPLPDGTNAEVKSSYETILLEIITNAHASYTRQANEASQTENNVRARWNAATDAERAAALAALPEV